jgi:hypothetical protein
MAKWRLHINKRRTVLPLKAVGGRCVSAVLCAILPLFAVVCNLEFFVVTREARADAETWFTPVLSRVGTSSSTFGTSVACGNEDVGVGHSWFAVGAPDEVSGQGRVYIVGPSGIVQTLQSANPGSNQKFGYFVAFITDINGDTNYELVVGEPNPSGSNGYIHVYLSTGNPAAPFSHCKFASGVPSFGSYILQTSIVYSGSAQIVVGVPSTGVPGISGRRITYDVFTGTCDVVADNTYGSTGNFESRYGQSIGEIEGASGSNLLIGAPGLTSSAGGVYQEESGSAPALEFTGSSAANLGASIASRFLSPLVAFSAPFALNTLSVRTHNQGVFSLTAVCDLQVPMTSLPSTASQSLVHLSNVFDGFVGISSGAVFGSYRDEAATGGSVVFFGVQSSTCTSLKQVNNCAADPTQKQGAAIAGGPQCYWTEGANAVVVGSPGFSSNSGRIDIYLENTESESPSPCTVPTNTPTPTSTPTATPTLEQALTPAPGFDSTPIMVEPSTGGLPAPNATVAGKNVAIVAPLLVGKTLKFIGYQFVVTLIRSSRSTLAVDTVAVLRTSAKKREIFSKRNRISLRNLAPGSYAVTYRPVFQSPKSRSKRILGKTSARGTFQVR